MICFSFSQTLHSKPKDFFVVVLNLPWACQGESVSTLHTYTGLYKMCHKSPLGGLEVFKDLCFTALSPKPNTVPSKKHFLSWKTFSQGMIQMHGSIDTIVCLVPLLLMRMCGMVLNYNFCRKWWNDHLSALCLVISRVFKPKL